MQPNQPVMPTGPSPASQTPFSTGPKRPSSGSSVTVILIAMLGLGALVFAVLTIVFYQKADVATNKLDEQVTAAVAKAKADQKKADDEANTIANESPFRSYIAPVEYGSFEIKFPKNWSGYIDQAQNGTQVSLNLNPDFIRRTNGTDELSATRVQLVERTSDQYLASYNSLIKAGKLKQNNLTVSGQKAFDITGTFADKKTTRLVAVPVRDKVLVFINENSRFASEFNEILAQSKIIP